MIKLNVGGPSWMPFLGVSGIAGLLEGRNFANMIAGYFTGCHTAWDVLERARTLDDAKFVVLCVSIGAVYLFGHGIVAGIVAFIKNFFGKK